MGTKLERISELIAQNPKMVFTSLYHLIDADVLKQCHREMNGRKATGVDKVTKDAYEAKLEENLSNLVNQTQKEKLPTTAVAARLYSQGKRKNAAAGNRGVRRQARAGRAQSCPVSSL